MKAVVNDQKYGEITYTEGNMLGKKSLKINGVELEKVDGKTFKYDNGEKVEYVGINGNYLTGVKLAIGGKEIALTPSVKWYECVLAIFAFAFLIAWGSIPQAVMILPIVGGAIGGGIYAVFAVLSLVLMKKTTKIWAKLLIWLGCFAAAILIGYVIAILVLASL